MKTVPLGVIGAMQRTHPALTQLFLKWTEIQNLDLATFDVVKPTQGPGDTLTEIRLKATVGLTQTWAKLCDTLGMAKDAPERNQMPVIMSPKAPGHAAFWKAMKQKELTEGGGPLEWWWRLHVLRSRGVKAASSKLLHAVFGDESEFDSAIIRLANPTLKPYGRRASDIISDSTYAPPTHLNVLVRGARKGSFEGFSFPLSVSTFKDKFVSTLIDHAVTRA